MKNGYGEDYDLPSDGLIYVDGSGIPIFQIEGKGFIIKEHKARIVGLSEFNKKIKKRVGGVLTVSSVLAEIRENIEYYKGIAKGVGKSRKKKKVGGCNFKRTFSDRQYIDDMFYLAKKGAKEYGRLCNILEDGMALYGSEKGGVDLEEMNEFVDWFDYRVLDKNSKLSIPDKELVVSALESGNGNGILVADKGIITAYDAGVKKFGLEECFICDSRQARSYFL
ncbi:hypothetical protein KAT36_02850 [Candidatus Pacearchaeota archaeon]|nr:hypothetical protein [Candidatus Pacearchaeota archaeon]